MDHFELSVGTVVFAEAGQRGSTDYVGGDVVSKRESVCDQGRGTHGHAATAFLDLSAAGFVGVGWGD